MVSRGCPAAPTAPTRGSSDRGRLIQSGTGDFRETAFRRHSLSDQFESTPQRLASHVAESSKRVDITP